MYDARCGCHDANERPNQKWNADDYPRDIVSWLLKAWVEKDVSAAPSLESLHEDSRVVIIAGRYVLCLPLGLEIISNQY